MANDFDTSLRVISIKPRKYFVVGEDVVFLFDLDALRSPCSYLFIEILPQLSANMQ